jgi:hypothetical protein
MPTDGSIVDVEREFVTGMYFRVERDGRWQNLDAATLTDEELATVLEGRSTGWLQQFGKLMAGWIRDNVAVDELVDN